MKINPSTPSPVSLPKAQPKKAAGSAPAGDAPAVRSSDPAPAPAPAAAPFDSQRVAEIRQAVADGRLKIDADKIAGRLLDGVQELLAKNRPAA